MAQKLDEMKKCLNDSLTDSGKPWKSAFDIIEEKSGIPRIYLFLGKKKAFSSFFL